MSASESKELETLRAGLAELEPSPDLADTVAAIAREAVPASRSPRLAAWLLPAAAALIVAGVLLARGLGSGPAGPPDGDRILIDKFAGSVALPPSPDEVAAARRANEVPTPEAGHTLPYGYRCSFDGDGLFEMWTDEHLAPIPKAKQRWVVLREEGVATAPKAYQYMSFPQEEGVLLMGPELLVPEDAMIRGAGGQIEVLTDQGVWKPEPGTRHLELTLGSPEAGGTTARVRCVLSTAYTGTLLVPDTLARALALNHFEVPGGFVAKLGGQEQPIQGQRALARVRIPELGVDRVIEVQARDPHHPRRMFTPQGVESKRTGALSINGAVPGRVAHADRLTLDADGSLGVLQHGEGSSMTLGLDEAKSHVQINLWEPGPRQVAFVYPERDGRPEATLVVGALDFVRGERPVYGFVVDWVTLAQTDEPGARVTIAKVWRGTQAIPSLEGAVVTQVGADGRIRFPRLAGEPASTLRMFVQRTSGSAFHEVRIADAADAGPILTFTVDASGTIRSGRSSWSASADPAPAIQGIASTIRGRQPQVERVAIRAHRDAPWDALACVLHGAAQADVRRIRHYAVYDDFTGTPGITFVDNELPADRGLQAEPLEAQATVVLRRFEDGRPHMQLRRGEETLSVALPDVPDINILRALVGALGERVQGQRGRIQILPVAQDAPAYLIQIALEAFHEAGATQVLFEAPAPASRRR